MKYAKIRRRDISNGPGVRVTLFVSGCTHKCQGCFNKEAQDFNYGKEFTDETVEEILEYMKDPNIVGFNLLGGEPLQQGSELLLYLLKEIKKQTGKSIWVWSGYTYEQIFNLETLYGVQILSYCDVLVDGKFMEWKKDLSLKYRGSSNQRIIDLNHSEIGDINEWIE